MTAIHWAGCKMVHIAEGSLVAGPSLQVARVVLAQVGVVAVGLPLPPGAQVLLLVAHQELVVAVVSTIFGVICSSAGLERSVSGCNCCRRLRR